MRNGLKIYLFSLYFNNLFIFNISIKTKNIMSYKVPDFFPQQKKGLNTESFQANKP